jgi:hypothetical protein
MGDAFGSRKARSYHVRDAPSSGTTVRELDGRGATAETAGVEMETQE